MATKKQIQQLADEHNIRVEFQFYSSQGELMGETRLTLPDGKLTADQTTGYTIGADWQTYSQHLSEVMQDLKELIKQK